MPGLCPECGAGVPEGGTCRSNFEGLLLLEWEVPRGPRIAAAHFLAVGAYLLQHPDSSESTVETLDRVRRSLGDFLAGRATLDQILARARANSNGPSQVRRRPGDAMPRWPVSTWPVSVASVLAGTPDEYADRVESWAVSVLEILDGADRSEIPPSSEAGRRTNPNAGGRRVPRGRRNR